MHTSKVVIVCLCVCVHVQHVVVSLTALRVQ